MGWYLCQYVCASKNITWANSFISWVELNSSHINSTSTSRTRQQRAQIRHPTRQSVFFSHAAAVSQLSTLGHKFCSRESTHFWRVTGRIKSSYNVAATEATVFFQKYFFTKATLCPQLPDNDKRKRTDGWIFELQPPHGVSSAYIRTSYFTTNLKKSFIA